MPPNFLTVFPFVSFLLDVIAKNWVRSILLVLKYVKDDVVLPIVVDFDFFHPVFYLFVFKAPVVFKVFNIHITWVYFYVDDYGTGHGLDGGKDVVDNHGTVRVGSVNVE